MSFLGFMLSFSIAILGASVGCAAMMGEPFPAFMCSVFAVILCILVGFAVGDEFQPDKEPGSGEQANAQHEWGRGTGGNQTL